MTVKCDPKAKGSLAAFDDCAGPQYVDRKYLTSGQPMWACKRHARALTEISPFAGYQWRPAK